MVVPISQSSALQRAGRAGRMRSGKVYHLFTEESYKKLQVSSVPEIQRSHLSPVVLQLKALGIDNVLRFHFLSVSSIDGAYMHAHTLTHTHAHMLNTHTHTQPPPADHLLDALELLYALEGKILSKLLTS